MSHTTPPQATGHMGVSGRIAAYFQSAQITPLLALVALLLGLFAVGVTPREEEPQINVTMANVFVPFPGASVRDVESLVATPAEQVISRISGIATESPSRRSREDYPAWFRIGSHLRRPVSFYWGTPASSRTSRIRSRNPTFSAVTAASWRFGFSSRTARPSSAFSRRRRIVMEFQASSSPRRSAGAGATACRSRSRPIPTRPSPRSRSNS